jgi:hypothetical protein
MFHKIISGGQTDADRDGLDFAIETGLEDGRYVPRVRKAEDGRIDDRHNLGSQPPGSPREPGETSKEAMAPVIFSLERVLSGGTKLTLELANKLGEPVLHI